MNNVFSVIQTLKQYYFCCS